MIDSYGREINYLRISVTDSCNLNCRYCRPDNCISKKMSLTVDEICTIVNSFSLIGVDKVRITGGEPLVRPDILKLIEGIRKIGAIKDLGMTTNGTNLWKYSKDLKNAGLDRVNISLDTLNEKKYSQITKNGQLNQVLKGLEAAKKAKLFPIKLNIVLIKDFNEDEIESFVNLTKDEEINVRFIELMPIGQLKNWSINRFLSNEIVLKKVPQLMKIPTKDLSSPAIYYRLPKGRGTVGLINPISCKFCEHCNRIRLTSEGRIKPCLHSNDEIDLRTSIRGGKDINSIICEIIRHKPKEHSLEQGRYILREMTAIGG